MTSYFRIQTSDYAAADLLIEDNQHSHSWGGPESYDREGVSACTSLEELAYYLAHSGIPYGIGEWIIVEMHADVIADADPMDASLGEVLVRPTAILSVRPMDDDFFAMVGDACDEDA